MIVLMRLIWAVWRAVIFSETQKATRSPELNVDVAQSRKLEGIPHSPLGLIIFATDCNRILLVEKSQMYFQTQKF